MNLCQGVFNGSTLNYCISHFGTSLYSKYIHVIQDERVGPAVQHWPKSSQTKKKSISVQRPQSSMPRMQSTGSEPHLTYYIEGIARGHEILHGYKNQI